MSLRQRLTILTASAVALAIIAAAGVAWLLVRSSMMEEIDAEMVGTVHQIDQILTAARSPEMISPQELRVTEIVQGDPVGVQVIEPDGQVHQVTFEPLTSALENAALPEVTDVQQPGLETVVLDGEHYRVLTSANAEGTVLRLFQPLSSVQATLSSVAWSMAGIAAAGVALAAVLGWLVTRTGLRPVDRLVDATERIAETQDLSHRITTTPGQRDEIARLADSVNGMLIALDRARSDQRELVENASHELRTPLAVLRNDFGLLARLERDTTKQLPEAERAELMSDLEAQVAALTDEVDEIIALAKGDHHSEPAQGTELLELVNRAVRRTRRVSPGVDIRIHGEPVESMVHPSALERAVANLIRNAAQVSDPGQRIDVRLESPGADGEEQVAIVVEDRGPGLREEEIPRLFTRFFRGAESRGRHGSGLGLAIVEQTAALHKGHTEAMNRPGGGARFTLRLPRRQATLNDS